MDQRLNNKYGEILPPGCPNLFYEVSMKINRYIFASSAVVGKRVLDIGCATGYGSAMLKEKGAKEVVGVDISSRALNIARRHHQSAGLSFLEHDVQRLPFPDGSFDVIIAFEVIEHLPKYHDFVVECRRVLKPGGIIFCSTPNKNAVSPGMDGTYRSHHFHEFYPNELVHLFSMHFHEVRLYGCVSFVKKEKMRDDLLYNLARRIAPHLPVRCLIAISSIVNLITWLPSLRNYKLIEVEKINDWNNFRSSRFQPYLLVDGAPVPLGLVVVATNQVAPGQK